jgi:hypothetical protein
MKTIADTTFFVLPEGATQEAQWSWADIEEMCASGQFTAKTRIFIAEDNEWVPAGDTELARFFDRTEPGRQKKDDKDEERETLEAEYKDALQRVKSNPEPVDALLEAGRLAAELDDREAATEHFQAALNLQPFNGRVALEVKRRFSKSECRNFKYLTREAPVWDNLPELAAYPLGRDIRYLGVIAGALCPFLFIPYGVYVLAALCFLLCLQVARHTAAGSSRPPLWHGALANPVRELVMPLVSAVLVVTEFLLVFYVLSRVTAAIGTENSVSAAEYVRNSPVLVVLAATVGLAYLPAVFVRLSHSNGIAFAALNPLAVVKSAVKMEQEYLMTLIDRVDTGPGEGGIGRPPGIFGPHHGVYPRAASGQDAAPVITGMFAPAIRRPAAPSS